MKKQSLTIFCIVICGTLFSSVYGISWLPADNIPPTNAFDKIHTDNGTIDSVNYSMPLNIKSGSGISVQSNNSTHTVTISNSALSTIQGTLNTTQANNANVNVGGYKLNFINGTGCTVNVKDSHSSTQTNVTISCTGSGGTITSINSQTGPAISITCVSGNTTCTNSTNKININTGNNLAYQNLSNNFTKENIFKENVALKNSTTAFSFIMFKNSLPASIGNIGRIKHDAYNSAGNVVTFNNLIGRATNIISGSESSRYDFQVLTSGTTLNTEFRIDGGNNLISSFMNFTIQPTSKLFLDGGGDTYITEASANDMQFFSGGSKRLDMTTTTESFGGGTNIVYRCATAGALPIGALTINAASCGTTVDTTLRVP